MDKVSVTWVVREHLLLLPYLGRILYSFLEVFSRFTWLIISECPRQQEFEAVPKGRVKPTEERVWRATALTPNGTQCRAIERKVSVDMLRAVVVCYSIEFSYFFAACCSLRAWLVGHVL